MRKIIIIEFHIKILRLVVRCNVFYNSKNFPKLGALQNTECWCSHWPVITGSESEKKQEHSFYSYFSSQYLISSWFSLLLLWIQTILFSPMDMTLTCCYFLQKVSPSIGKTCSASEFFPQCPCARLLTSLRFTSINWLYNIEGSHF